MEKKKPTTTWEYWKLAPSSKWRWFIKEYLRTTRKWLETKLYSGNLIKWITAWAVTLIRYPGSFLKWTREEFTQMDQRTWKLMQRWLLTHKWGRRLASTEDSVNTSIQWLEDYIEKRREGLITAIKNNTDNTKIHRMETTKNQNGKKKQLYGCFKQLTSNILHDKSCTWQRKGNFKRETKYLVIATQNKIIRTNHIKARTYKTQQNRKCRLCDDGDEMINHMIIECNK